jgi:hypothetical protein
MNTATGQSKSVITSNEHDCVRWQLTMFALREGITAQAVDLQLFPLPCYA